MGDRPMPINTPASSKPPQAPSTLPLRAIEADPKQPRRVFAEAELKSLADSLDQHGLLEPVVVHAIAPGRYQLIAGERRFRAATMLGWTEIPAVIRQAHEQTNLILALVENLQREDLSPLEEAEAYQRLKEDHGMTQARIATVVGKRRATVANAMRLLGLGDEARQALSEGMIDRGHARALLGIDDRSAQADAVAACIKEGWSVRRTEAYVKNLGTPSKTDKTTPKTQKSDKDGSYPALSSAIGLQVNLSGRKIVLTADTREDAQLFLDRLTRMVRGVASPTATTKG